MPACQTVCYRLEPTQIHFLKFVLEGYEGLGVLTTLDAERGVVRLSLAPGCEAELGALMGELARELHQLHLERLERCSEPPPQGGRAEERGNC